MRRNHRSPLLGITLIELVITIAVAAIVITVGIPSFARLISKSRMTGEMNTLVSNLQLARSEAIKRGSRVSLCPVSQASTPLTCVDSSAWHTGYIVFSDSDHTAATRPAPTDQIIRHEQGRSDAPITITTSAGRSSVTYQPDGTSPGTNAKFTFCDVYRRIPPRAVLVSNTGRPRNLSDPTGLVCP
jgi:type IV fimbrial biogenesis protein FimT